MAQQRSKPGLAGVSASIVSRRPHIHKLSWILIGETRTLALDVCSANSGFQPTLAGGNGANVPYCALRAVVVSHQGTDPAQL